MKLLFNAVILIFNLYVRRLSKGAALRIFSTHMGVVYIKLSQMLAMWNIDGMFTEMDRQELMSVCDDCNPIPFHEIEKILKTSYGKDYEKLIKKIDRKPVGAASVSQVHRAILFDGSRVVFKVKRRDIYNDAKKSIRQVRVLVHKFGWVIGFKNKMGSDKALEHYIKWIEQELDFEHEVYNIKKYTRFAQSVNGKFPGCADIVIPKVYDKYCTKDIIVMEYVIYPTIVKSHKNDNKCILHAFDSYIQLSMYALLHDMPVIFHGDPHGGNVYIDNNGNIGFLDMGLLFELTPEDAKAVKELFFCAYFGQTDKLYKILVPCMNGNAADKKNFYDDIKNYCENISTRPVTAYFMDMVLVCFKYNIVPPDYLFGMAKAFVCLGGIDTIYDQNITGKELLADQVYDYVTKKFISNINEWNTEHVELLTGIITNDKSQITRIISNDIRRLISAINFISDKIK